jgi:NlpC/P60 family protein
MRALPYVIRTGGHGGKPVEVAVFDPRNAAWLASFTVGAHTVLLLGPPRRFREAGHVVAHAAWVRVLPEAFCERNIDPDWLAKALAANGDNKPDVLAIAMQYIGDAASYGPLTGDTREEGSDFNDYLGIAWQYPDEPTDPPEQRQFGCMDCSGYVRMVYGYRSNMALCRAPREDRAAIPRRAHEMASHAPGVKIPCDDAAPGDLVFFDADVGDDPQIDHVGIYMGRDTKGHRRFLSSRKRADGPTMGDTGGRSILDGDGLYAGAFRKVRRL